MNKSTKEQWLISHMGVIETDFNEKCELISKIKAIDEEICYECNIWTALKLIVLDYAINICIPIIKNSHFTKICYVDLFANSGINKLKNEHDDYFIGSALIPLLRYKDMIDHFYYCEIDESSCKALNDRAAVILESDESEKISIICGDCNDHINNFLDELSNSKTYSFFFIDPFKFNLDWNTMKKILDIRSDIMFIFMTNLIYRSISKCRTDGSTPALDKLYGNSDWKDCHDGTAALNLYITKIKNRRPTAVIETIRITGVNSFYYDMIFITRKTRNENPWMNGIRKVKAEIENQDIKKAKNALDILKGRQTALSSWFK